MNKIEKVSDSKEWKDQMAGWSKWRIHIAECRGCGKVNTFYELSGTKEDAERFAKDAEYNYCENCS